MATRRDPNMDDGNLSAQVRQDSQAQLDEPLPTKHDRPQSPTGPSIEDAYEVEVKDTASVSTPGHGTKPPTSSKESCKQEITRISWEKIKRQDLTSNTEAEGGPASADSDPESLRGPSSEWRPSKKEYMVILSLAFISLMVALDATILVSVLPVSDNIFFPGFFADLGVDAGYRPPRQRH